MRSECTSKKEKTFSQSPTRPFIVWSEHHWVRSLTQTYIKCSSQPQTPPPLILTHTWHLCITDPFTLRCWGWTVLWDKKEKSNWHPHHDPESLEELVQGKPTGLDHVIAVELVGVWQRTMWDAWSNEQPNSGYGKVSQELVLLIIGKKKKKLIWRGVVNDSIQIHQILILLKCWLYFKRPMIQSTPSTFTQPPNKSRLAPLIKPNLLTFKVYWLTTMWLP